MTLQRLKSANSKKNIIRDVLVINILYINQHKNVATTFHEFRNSNLRESLTLIASALFSK